MTMDSSSTGDDTAVEDGAQPPPPSSDAAASEATETALQMSALPREVGVMLVSVGALGMVLPGMMGSPAILAGGLVLWPKGFSRVDGWFRRRYPELHGKGMRQIGRYLDDLERRFPELKRK